MSKGIGRLISCGIGKETTRGTAVSATYWLPWSDLTADEKKDWAVDSQSYGIVEDNVNISQVKKMMQGQITGNVHDTTFGLILLGMLGNLVSHNTHSGESVVYDNVYSVQQSAQRQSLTILRDDPIGGQDYSFALGVLHKLDINIELKKFISYVAAFKALSGTTTTTTPSTTSENRFLPQHAAIKFAPTYAGLQGTLTATGTAASTTHVTALSISTTLLRVGMTVTGTNVPANTTITTIVSATAFDLSAATTGAVGTMTFGPAVVALKSAKVTFTSDTDDQEVIGNVAPADFLAKEFVVDGSFEAIWQNETDFKSAFMGPTTQAVRIDIKNSDVVLGSATNPELIIDMPKCTFQELSTPFKLKDIITQSVKFKASYSATDTALVKVTLTNTTNGY